ncbi:MAK10-like protein [Tanacetum coccineum]
MRDENPIRTLRDYSKPSHEGYRNTIELPIENNVLAVGLNVFQQDPSPHGRILLPDSLLNSFHWEGPHNSATISWCSNNIMENLYLKHGLALLEDLALYDNESWNDPRDFAKPVKGIALPQDVPSTSDRRLIELETQVQRLMEAYLAPTQPTQVNKITTSCEICSGPHNTQYCMEDPEQAFVEYTSSRTDEAGGKWYTFKLEQNNLGDIYNPSWRSHPNLSLRQPEIEIEPQQPEEPEPTLDDEFQDLHLNLPVLEVLAHVPIYNAILDKYVESLELGKNGSTFFQGEIPAKMEYPGLFTLPCRSGDSKPFDALADLGSCVNIILLYLFKKLNIRLLEETDHIFGLADRTKSYPVGIVKDVEVHIGKLKLLNDFYVIDMKKDPETPLLVGRGFLATANAVIDCRMAKIAVGEGITRSVFRVKGVDLGEEEAPYWTTLRKKESYKPRPHSNGIGARTPYYARKDFLNCHLPGEWLYLMRRSLEVLRKFHWMILRGQFNHLSHVSSPLLSKPWEY